MKPTRGDALLLIALLAAAYQLKRHYSHATVAELDWILAPTAALVETTTPTPFVRDSAVGYVNTEQRFAIAKPCAGVNFLIVSGCSAVFAVLSTRRSLRVKMALAAGALASAYAVTLLANGIRIATAMRLRAALPSLSMSSWERLHLLQGVFIYTLFLYCFYLLARRVAGQS